MAVYKRHLSDMDFIPSYGILPQFPPIVLSQVNATIILDDVLYC